LKSKNSLIFLVIVVVFAALSIWGVKVQKPAYGLDVQGGVRLTFQIDHDSIPKDNTKTIPQILRTVQKNLARRATGSLGVVEPLVLTKGQDQIIVELPGFTDIEEAKETMSSTAKIQVYHAKTVTNPQNNRRYNRSDERTEDGAPVIYFTRGTSTDEIGPGTDAYAEIIDSWGDPILEGEDVKDAGVIIQGQGKYQPEFFFSSEGAKKLEAFTKRHSRFEENIAFVLDGRVLNVAPIRKGAILSDNAFVDGDFDPEYVRQLTEMIKSGSLPVDLDLLSSLKVDPTIGKKALDEIVKAGLISFVAICVFLIIYYAFPGVIAAVAMSLYVLATIAAMEAMNVTFSLAAIAALVLSVGMAVDANILVFERIKEELRNGRKLTTAIHLGFTRAMTAILDSNISTILTSVVLWQLGTGPVKGFATTLIVGVVISFITAFTITRGILVGLVDGAGFGTNPKWYGLNRAWFGEKLEAGAKAKPLNIVGNSKRYFLISGGFIVIGMLFVGIGGMKPNVEFQGGFEGIYQMPSGSELTRDEAEASLGEAGITKSNIKFGEDDDGRVVYVTIPYDAGIERNEEGAVDKVAGALGLSAEKSSFQEISPSIQQETVMNAIYGIVIASALIVLFLAVRFGIALGGLKNGIRFGMSAIAALIHDVLVVVGTAGIVGYLLGWEISSLFVTAMLTVIGFSVHDSIVIFDRIRENLKRPVQGESFQTLVDKSITQSVARSINTSFTAIVPLIILIAIGTPTPELKFMCVAMLTGIVVGTYSSIFNAAPILWLWDKAIMKKRGEKAGLMAEAMREAKLRAQRLQTTPAGVPGVGGGGDDAPAAGDAYGTIKRRSGVKEQATQNLDDLDDEDLD
jgi:SecD/SecF fusion protein